MHLRNVEIFCDVCIYRSFSKAAEANSVSQSSASQAVQVLEDRLGTLLIDRSQRPLQLTAAGKIYFDGCRRLVGAFRKVEDRIQRMNNTVTGRVHVTAIYSAGLLQMDSYVKRYQELYPDVDLRVDYVHPDEVYESVLNDTADLGLVSFPRDGGEFSSVPWQEQAMALVVPPGHRLARRPTASVRDLAGKDFINFRSSLTIRKQLDRWFKQAGITVNVVHEFDDIENIKRAVEIGSGIAVLPVQTVQREHELGSLVVVEFRDAKWYRPLGIIHKRHKTLSTAADKFLEILREAKAVPDRERSTLFAKNGNGNGKSKHAAPRVRAVRRVSHRK